jgi:predicted nucleotidyltransferase
MFTDNQLKVLAVLMSQPEKEYYLSELGEILGKKPGFFQRGINSLEEKGIIKSRMRGNLRLFKVNERYPLYREIKSIVEKTAGVKGLLQELVDEMEGIEIAFIYGSYARDTMRVDSDIDLAIVAKGNIEADLLEKLRRIEARVDREINYRLYSRTEFRRKRRKKDPFLEEILSERYLLLKGDLGV